MFKQLTRVYSNFIILKFKLRSSNVLVAAVILLFLICKNYIGANY